MRNHDPSILETCWLVIVVLLAGGLKGQADQPTPPKRPNFVFILADDLGWGDISCHGGPTPTPHIDGLMDTGVQLVTFLVTPVCSPTRAALLTGQNPVRVGIAPMTVNMDKGGGLRAEDTTLAKAFGANGYATACVGKWHLGKDPPPNGQGFDLFYGCLGAAVDYLNRTRKRDGTLDWQENEQPLDEKGYTTNLIRDRAVRYINGRHSRPFFLYVPFTAVHNPQQASKPYLDRVPDGITDSGKRTYAAMTIALDDAVGAILQALQEQRLAKNTVVVFASDNGATRMGSNLPFRGGKHTLYEGGVHSPAVVRWPTRLKGGRHVDALLTMEDMYPTLLAMAGVAVPEPDMLDGMDFLPLLLEEASFPRRHHCWIWRDCDAIRTERWKLLRFVDHRELYDLKSDPSEAKNVSTRHPEIVADLDAKLSAWEASVPCFPSHVPVKLPAPARAEPRGDVLEVRAERTAAGERDPLYVLVTRSDVLTQPGDRLEYDMLIATDSARRGFFVDMTNKAGGAAPFGPAKAVDQYGIWQRPDKGFPQAEGRWAKRVIGQAGRCPATLGAFRVGLVGSCAARYRFYLDNVIVRRANGDIIELYRDGPLKLRSVSKSKAYSDVSVRVMPLTRVDAP